MNQLKLAVLSDIHLGHRRNPTREIIANLDAAFPDDARTAQLDIVFFAGDVFDDLLNLPDEDVWEIKIWISRFLRLCKKHDIMVEVLEGTPSHDWKQSQLFTTINEVAHIGAEVRYHNTLSIQYFERFDINVLYVPDEWDTTENTLSQVHELLRAKGLTQVDYAIMHGQFEYQLPPVVKAPKHNSAEYLKLVRHLIFIGHVHIHSRYERIIAQGSFDRLSHNEEGPKGHVRATIYPDGTHEVQFVENKGAKRFVTLRCTEMDLNQIVAEAEARVGELPIGSYVRVEAMVDNPILTNMEELIRRFPLIKWEKIARDYDDVEQNSTLEEEDTPFTPIMITRDNLSGLLMERITRTGTTGDVLEAAELILKEVL